MSSPLSFLAWFQAHWLEIVHKHQEGRTWLTGLCRRLARGSCADLAPACHFRSSPSTPWRRGIEVGSLTIISIPLLLPVPQEPPCPCPSCCASCLSNLAACTAVWSSCWWWDCLSSCWWTPTTCSPPSRRMNSLTDASSTSTSVPPALAPAGAANSWTARFPSRPGVAYVSWTFSMSRMFTLPSTVSPERAPVVWCSNDLAPTRSWLRLTRKSASGPQAGHAVTSSRRCTRLNSPGSMAMSVCSPQRWWRAGQTWCTAPLRGCWTG